MLVGIFLLVGVVLIAKPPSIFGAANSTYDVIGKVFNNINRNIILVRNQNVNEKESNFIIL